MKLAIPALLLLQTIVIAAGFLALLIDKIACAGGQG
jgi:hypothetical protein